MSDEFFIIFGIIFLIAVGAFLGIGISSVNNQILFTSRIEKRII